MIHAEPPSPVLFFDILIEYQESAALKAALELGDRLKAAQSWTAGLLFLQLRFRGVLVRPLRA